MYKCDTCGYECETLPEVKDYIEKGDMCVFITNDNDICKSCERGIMEHAKQCPVCKEWFCESDYDYMICDKCFKELCTFENGYKYYCEADGRDEIEINMYLKAVVRNLKINVDKLIFEYAMAHYTTEELDDIMRKPTMTMLVCEGEDAEEFLLSEGGFEL